MGVLSDLEPKRVFYYFEEISKIPRGSYHEKEISDYLVSFAKQKNIRYIQDELYNVILFLPASAGYEQKEPVILQGHMDMVCEKKPDAKIDMEKEGIRLLEDGNYVFAQDTTLGGDDGIAIAYMLAIAESDELAHPPLEMIITVSEEVGMNGANHIDLSMIQGHKMLNLDSEEEGIFLTSCAGGLSAKTMLPVSRNMLGGLCWCKITISGLLGGHSGCEIDKGRANAIHVLGRVLYELNENVHIELVNLEGGKKDNAIPNFAFAVIGLKEEHFKNAQTQINQLDTILKSEYAKSDAGIKVEIQRLDDDESKFVVDPYCFSHILNLLMTLPKGIQDMSMSVKGLVETSLNLGIMKLNDDHLYLQHAIRSSVTTKKYYVANQIECLVKHMGGTVEYAGEYPAWEYLDNSIVRKKTVMLYEKMFGRKPIVEGIHAGLECGILASKIEGLDCVSFGPDILDIHTTSERLDIQSTKRVYEFLLELLKEI